jgi:uncharacterized membrane protein
MWGEVSGAMNKSVSSKTDLMYEVVYNSDFVPIPSPNVSVKMTVEGGKKSYLMKNRVTGIIYEPDEPTVMIWNLVDGKRSVKEIVSEVQVQRPKFKEDDVTGVLLFFADSNLLESSLEQPKKKRFQVVSAFEMDYRLIDKSKDFLEAIHRKVRPVLKRPLLWASVVFIIVSAALFAGRFVSIFGNKSNFQILGSSVVGFFFYYFVALAPVIAIHEIAHGLALVHYGGEPREMGAGLFYFGPMFYTETTDVWSLEKKHRMMVYLAGNISTLLIGSIITFIVLFASFPQPAGLILTMVAFYCFDIALFNFAPPFETDGYYILSDALNMPNLRHESYGYVGSLAKRIFSAKSKSKTSGLTRKRKWILIAYTMLSVGWIMYIVFQTSLFLSYMSQDITVSFSNVFHAILTSQAFPSAAIVITVLSVVYFGMQILGYGSLFLAAVNKAAKKPLHVEAIHDRALSVFAYLPPKTPQSISSSLRHQIEKTARRFTSKFDITQSGRSCTAVLRLGGANLAFSQIKDSLKNVEDEFGTGYEKLILSHKDELQKSIGIYSPGKMELTSLLEQMATESANSGNSGAPAIVKACEEKQKETILYLLISAFGTVWTIEVQPAHEYEIQKEIMPDIILQDLTLTDLYGDCENFKKSIVYGYDTLAKLAEDTERGLAESLSQPQQYQLVGLFEPIRNRMTFIGRTEELEKKIHMLAPYFDAVTWSGYLDNLLFETCYSLEALNKVRLPNANEIKQMSIGELTVLATDLSRFAGCQELVNNHILSSENYIEPMNQNLQTVRDTIRPSENFEIGLLEATFNVNAENLEALPNRIRDFRKRWKTVCEELRRIKNHVDEEYEKRKTEIAQKKRKMVKIYPGITAISVLLLALNLIPPLATFWIPLVTAAFLIQLSYWIALYLTRKSLRTATKYPSEAFKRIHLLLFAWIEAIYPYITTGDILIPE